MTTVAGVQAGGQEPEDVAVNASGHLMCPFCNSYDVERMFLASVNLDSCQCLTCCARWDEERGTGAYRGRSRQSSVLMPRTE